jgi:hypothetical protein
MTMAIAAFAGRRPNSGGDAPAPEREKKLEDA